jgi:hypothetical protein
VTAVQPFALGPRRRGRGRPRRQFVTVDDVLRRGLCACEDCCRHCPERAAARKPGDARTFMNAANTDSRRLCRKCGGRFESNTVHTCPKGTP